MFCSLYGYYRFTIKACLLKIILFKKTCISSGENSLIFDGLVVRALILTDSIHYGFIWFYIVNLYGYPIWFYSSASPRDAWLQISGEHLNCPLFCPLLCLLIYLCTWRIVLFCPWQYYFQWTLRLSCIAHRKLHLLIHTDLVMGITNSFFFYEGKMFL